jgi:hypothetical protein
MQSCSKREAKAVRGKTRRGVQGEASRLAEAGRDMA